ncbi:Uncharacterised protein [Aeromonas hydrophila]|uniref:hypothetical protein n=1 Tax=Aeromonas taiwanensis TaxID=633417 RepID=UPI001F9B9AF2|nr:Uncharacterised protein [Aeromonas hydrophila]
MDFNEESALEQLLLCEQIRESEGTDYPDDTYEDGVEAALLWVLGQAAAPLDAEEFPGRLPLQFER